MVRLFVIYHDHQHGSILRGSRVGRLLMEFSGLLLLSPASVWHYSHTRHHRDNSRLGSGSIGSFPIMTTDDWASAPPLRRLLYRLNRSPLLIALSYPIAFLGSLSLGYFLWHPRRHADGLLAVILHAAIAVALCRWGGWQALLFAQTLPFLVACAVGGYLFYAQHNFPEVMLYGKGEWTYDDAALHSSSHLRMGRLLRWFTGNIGYHHIHHLNARIPFYRLPSAARSLPSFDQQVGTSLRLRDIWRCLRLALWDSSARRMVPYSGVRAQGDQGSRAA
jgi:omega-6 fatty acid desaturase (delta-12 desaturase)